MILNPKKSADRYVILVICHIGQQNVTGRSNVDVSSCGAVLLNANYVLKSIPSQLVDEKGLITCSVLNLHIALSVHGFLCYCLCY